MKLKAQLNLRYFYISLLPKTLKHFHAKTKFIYLKIQILILTETTDNYHQD